MRKNINDVLLDHEYIYMRNCFVKIERQVEDIPAAEPENIDMENEAIAVDMPNNLDVAGMPSQIEERRQSVLSDHAYSLSPIHQPTEPQRIEQRRASEPLRKPFYIRGRRPTK